MELGEEAENLIFEREHQLSSKPLAMDLLVIKKEAGVQIHKNIGRIFRRHNIVEFKSPKDYLSINDFYKVYAYTCLYQSDTEKVCEILPSEMTITLICKNYPRKMMHHLQNERKMRIIKVEKGIYYLEGDEFAMQILVTKKLSKEENYWLNCLRDDLRPEGEIRQFIERYERGTKDKWYQDLADTILRGNWDNEKEEDVMCDAIRELIEEHFEEMFGDKIEKAEKEAESRGMEIGESRGIEIGARAIIQTNQEFGVTREVIIQKLQRELQIDKEKAEEYYSQNAV